MPSTKKNIVFFHPDLGIGGAERLVIDAAVGLQNLGHKVTIFTSHCDPTHCFDEARDGVYMSTEHVSETVIRIHHADHIPGTLDVRVRGNTLIPSSILGRLFILCAILRQLHLVLQITLFTTELRDLRPEAFFIDQLSACVPLLRLTSTKARIIFYCHFPDKLLAQRQGWVKKLYRIPFDWIESWTTGASDVIVVNSKFTRGIFKEAFPGLQNRDPSVVYPCVDVAGVEESSNGKPAEALWKDKKVLLSINRFERKKDIGLAIKAFAGLSEHLKATTRLVIAGKKDHSLLVTTSPDILLTLPKAATTSASLKTCNTTTNSPP